MQAFQRPVRPADSGEITERFKDLQCWEVEGVEASSKKTHQDKEEDEVNALQATIVRLEKTLNQEVKRRSGTNQTIQRSFEAHMETIQDRLEAGLLHRLDGLMSSVDSLHERITAMEEDFSTSRQSYIRDMEDKSTLVADDIVSLKAMFTAERKERRERETLIIARLRDLDERTEEQIDKDQRTLEFQVAALNEELGVVGHEEDRRFHEYVFTELAALRKGLDLEAGEREQADDEIVDTLNRYTQSVQEAMRVVNQSSAQ